MQASVAKPHFKVKIGSLDLLKKQHQPRWVLIELGANDGLQGYPIAQTKEALQNIITQVKEGSNATLYANYDFA